MPQDEREFDEAADCIGSYYAAVAELRQRHVLSQAVKAAAMKWYGDEWMESLRRIARAGRWGLRKRQMFTRLVQAEYAARCAAN